AWPTCSGGGEVSGEPGAVITCDLEGRIEGFDPRASALFGYEAEEVVKRKRIPILMPGHIAVGHLGGWLKRAGETGEFRTETVCLRKNGSPFTADLKITPNYCDGRHIGFTSVAVARPEVPVEQAMPEKGLKDWVLRWVVILRLPFMTASLVGVVIGAAWGGFSRPEVSISPWWFVLVLVGGGASHLAANVFNDYFDRKGGVDEVNTEYFSPFSGGSRAVDLGFVSERGTFIVASVSLLVAAAVGLFLIVSGRTAILYFGLFGALSGYFYSAPPLRLAGRKGLGEFVIGLDFGVLLAAGTVYALTGTLSLRDFLIGVPIGLLTTAILYVNQFADMRSDAATGKHHLVVVLGKQRACYGYLFLLLAAFAFQVGMVATGLLPVRALWPLLTIPLAFTSIRTVFRHYDDRSLVGACRGTILLQLLFGLLSAAGLFWS
ncbi:MAG: UbiA family prenyltransferase, partial [Pseudomonadota bacterium]